MAKNEKTSQNENKESEYRNQIPDFKYTPIPPPQESDSDTEKDSDE